MNKLKFYIGWRNFWATSAALIMFSFQIKGWRFSVGVFPRWIHRGWGYKAIPPCKNGCCDWEYEFNFWPFFYIDFYDFDGNIRR